MPDADIKKAGVAPSPDEALQQLIMNAELGEQKLTEESKVGILKKVKSEDKEGGVKFRPYDSVVEFKVTKNGTAKA